MKTFYTIILIALTVQVSAKGTFGNKFSGPHYFIQNVGQVTDQYGQQRKDIAYKLKGGNGLSVFISAGELHYQFSTPVSAALTGMPPASMGKVARYDMYRMDMVLEGANTDAVVSCEEPSAYFEQYYTPQFDMQTGGIAHAYSRLTYKNIYPHIDWVLYVKEGVGNGMEYDFVVHPGGNPADIQLRYDGVTGMMQDAGGITASTPQGMVQEAPPVCYELETGKKIIAAYNIKGNKACIATGSYSGTLVIDPVLQWGTYLGGTSMDQAYGIASDTSNNAYLCGETNSTSNIATAGSYQAASGGNLDAFLAKFNRQGQLLWCTYLGGSQLDDANFVTVNAGQVYISGEIGSTNINIATPGVYYTTQSAGYIAAFNLSGQLQWATYTRGSVVALASDASGNVYAAGNTPATTGIGTPGTYQSTSTGGNKGYLIQLNSTGQQNWGTYLDGYNITNHLTQTDAAIALDHTGNIYFANTITSGLATTASSHQSAPAGSYDIGLIKFTNSGQMVWETYYGGSGTDYAEGLACDQVGNVYLAGATFSASGIATAGSYMPVFSGFASGGGYLAKWNSNGQLLWGTYDTGPSILNTGVVCKGNNVYTTGGAFTSSGPGFLSRFNSNGQLQYITSLGNLYTHTLACGVSTSTASSALLFIGGETNSTGNIATTGAYQTLLGTSGFSSSQDDAFLQCYTMDTLVSLNTPYGDTVLCVGTQMKLVVSSDSFAAGNVYTVQLSNAAGSFANPTVIGRDTAVFADTIKYTIPNSVASGTGYRIRVVTSKPADTTNDDGVNIRIVNLQNTLTSNSPVCFGDSIIVSSSGTYAGATQQWTTPGGVLQYGQSIHEYNANAADSGNYILNTFTGTCSYKDTVHVVVKASPAIPTVSSNSPVCANGTLNLTASTTTIGVSYSWSGPAGYTSSTQNPVRSNVPANATGTYIVTVTANGCSVQGTTQVVIDTAGTPTVTIHIANSTVCVGQPAIFTATTVNAGASPTYQWKVNGSNIAGATLNTYSTTTLTDGAVVTCAVLSSALNCQASQNLLSNPITVHILPIKALNITVSVTPVNYTPGTQVTFTALGGSLYSNINFQWYDNGVAMPGNTSSSFTTYSLKAGDKISLLAWTTDPCLSPDSVRITTNALQINPLYATVHNIAIYPNPAIDNVILSSDGIAGPYTRYCISDIVGHKLVWGTINNDKQQISIDNLNKGIYLITVFENNIPEYIQKLVVQ